MQNPDPDLIQTREALQQYWGYTSFLDGQEEAITSVLQGRDTMVLFPTGGGKSLCYQLPSLLLGGITLVISPLVSLMEDQVTQVKEMGIPATWVNSTISLQEVEQRLINARNGMYKLLYLSPERLSSPLWQQLAPDLDIALVAVDEAHCISEWGHDFRPGYREIRQEIDQLEQSVRWIALTATATPEVRKDILQSLRFEDPTMILGRFERANLQWWVNRSPQKSRKLLQAVSRGVSHGSGIVYAATRRDCEDLVGRIKAIGVTAEAYHAGVPNRERKQVQSRWMSGETPVVVATNAFGMGIDKADCRFVIHHDIPWTLEAYYQEAGRAGRDGEEAWPLLLYREGDLERAKSRLEYAYPGYDQLAKLYDAVCDEMNLAVGSEQEHWEAISIDGVARRSGLTPARIRSGLNQLERQQVLELLNPSEERLGLQFLVGRETLEEIIRRAKPQKGEFLDQLFRLFGLNSLERMVFKRLSMIERRLSVDSESLFRAMEVFSADDRLLAWQRTDRHPLVRLPEVRRGEVPVSRKQIEGYRNRLFEKLQLMARYAETEECRERFLRIYFGETNAGRCGHCDRCLDRGKSDSRRITRDDLQQVQTLLAEPATFSELLAATGWESLFLQEVLERLAAEGRIEKSQSASAAYHLKS